MVETSDSAFMFMIMSPFAMCKIIRPTCCQMLFKCMFSIMCVLRYPLPPFFPFSFFSSLVHWLSLYHQTGKGNLHCSIFRITKNRSQSWGTGTMWCVNMMVWDENADRADTMLVNWNLRGLNQPAKWSRVFSQLKKIDAEIVYLLETKILQGSGKT